MWLTRFIGKNFRNFSEFEIRPGSGVNIVFGENGSGKTSLLEGLYLFGFGRSFRPGGFKPLIQEGSEGFTLFIEGELTSSESTTQRYGMSRDIHGQQQLKINGAANVRLADLAKSLPVQLFTPESVEVIAGGPSVRRHLIDWGVFHVEHSFFSLWASYNKVLRHRNKLLKMGRGKYSASEDKYWLEQLCEFGEQITQLRYQYLDRLGKYLQQTIHSFLPDVTLEVLLKCGWDKSKRLSVALSDAVENDVKYGYTTVGPHKADLQIIADGVTAKERLSRGQMKVVVASIKLAQSALMNEHCNKRCIVIVDDLTSELDTNNQKIFCRLLEESGSQVFLSSVSLDKLAGNFTKDPAMFHVEHGILKRHIEN